MAVQKVVVKKAASKAANKVGERPDKEGNQALGNKPAFRNANKHSDAAAGKTAGKRDSAKKESAKKQKVSSKLDSLKNLVFESVQAVKKAGLSVKAEPRSSRKGQPKANEKTTVEFRDVQTQIDQKENNQKENKRIKSSAKKRGTEVSRLKSGSGAALVSVQTLNGALNGASHSKRSSENRGSGKSRPSGRASRAGSRNSADDLKKSTYGGLTGRSVLDITGETVCREVACEGLATTGGYCRLHYIKNWKKIKRKEVILYEKKLNQYIEELVAKYPDKYIEAIRQDLASDKEFAKVIYDLDLDEGVDEFDVEGGDSVDTLIDSIKRDFDDDTDAF